MPDAGTSQIDALQQDIACPGCSYNLRGLPGAVVHCPECGLLCDMAQLITRKWLGPWWKAPGFNSLVLPSAVSMLGPLGAIVPALLARSQDWDVGTAVLVYFLALGAGWGSMLCRLALRGGSEAVGLALLANGIIVAYVVAGWGSLGLLIAGVVALRDGFLQVALLYFVIAAVCVLVLYGGRRGERHIAECCIRRHLQGKPPF